jgi:A/G-specific adenine glycosylase
LAGWYEHSKRALPWRQDSNPYRVYVSEIMLQQTQAETVIPYYHHWLARFPDLAALAAAEEAEVLKLWEGLGYYTRARNLLRAARILVSEHGGRLPESAATLARLPGVGPYASAAVASIAFGEPVGVVDGNVARVYARLAADGEDSSRPAFRRRARACVEAGMAGRDPGLINQAWMELGALVCRPRPNCPACPLQRVCRARAAGREQDFPVKASPRPVPVRRGRLCIILALHAAAARSLAARLAAEETPAGMGRLIRQSDAPLLLVKERTEGLLGGLWGFPVFPEDAPESTAPVSGLALLKATAQEIRHAYSHFAVRYTVTLAALPSTARLEGFPDQAWVLPAGLAAYPRARVHIKAMERFGLAT